MTKVKNTLSQLGVKPSKTRGQNFLIDENLTNKIFLEGNISSSDNIIEIGPGLGALTKYIYKTVPHTAVEIEENFCEQLKKQFPELRIINEDVRKVDFSALGVDQIIFGNLPYSFSTDIIFHLVEYKSNIKRMVFLLQKEFAERMAASPGGKDYGVLSVNLQIFFDVKLGIEIPGNCFHPPTKVTSRVVILEPKKIPVVPENEIEWFKKCVKASFLQRRKKIPNSIKSANIIHKSDAHELIKKACEQINIDPNRRAETLSLVEFLSLSRSLKSII
jgi:16S rRNA (adenine1518-N6/adenine1519-N6)-dimethyltransferase